MILLIDIYFFNSQKYSPNARKENHVPVDKNNDANMAIIISLTNDLFFFTFDI